LGYDVLAFSINGVLRNTDPKKLLLIVERQVSEDFPAAT
jgi:hypothetical protein